MATILRCADARFEPPVPDSPGVGRDATNKRVTNHRMKRGLGVELIYPDITTGLPAATEAVIDGNRDDFDACKPSIHRRWLDVTAEGTFGDRHAGSGP